MQIVRAKIHILSKICTLNRIGTPNPMVDMQKQKHHYQPLELVTMLVLRIL